jgi:hypothetical protein
VRIESIVGAAALVHAEGESYLLAARTNCFLILSQLLRRQAAFLGQVFIQVLPFDWHG